MDIREMFPARFLVPWDLRRAGLQRAALIIDGLDREEIYNRDKRQKESAIVIFFKGIPKPWILKKTSAQTIAKVLGEWDSDNWAGKAIRLIIVPDARAESGEVLRVDEKAPAPGEAIEKLPAPIAKGKNGKAGAGPRPILAPEALKAMLHKKAAGYAGKIGAGVEPGDRIWIRDAMLQTFKDAMEEDAEAAAGEVIAWITEGHWRDIALLPDPLAAAFKDWIKPRPVDTGEPILPIFPDETARKELQAILDVACPIEEPAPAAEADRDAAESGESSE